MTRERMETVGVRFPLSDIEWLASLSMKDALTPSDKIRAIVAEARRRNEGLGDYEAALSWLRDLLAPAISAIKGREFRSENPGMHSELVALAAEWLPQTLALLLAQGAPERGQGEGQEKQERQDNAEMLMAFEVQLARRAFQFCESLLRLGVGRSAPCYDSEIIRSGLPRIIELAEVVSFSRNRE
ncbi:MAG: hypothetical protein LBD67_07680 [Candidatus Accumulibacter sp.]|nr:hypothetical protein [Accumulibacter sp.]